MKHTNSSNLSSISTSVTAITAVVALVGLSIFAPIEANAQEKTTFNLTIKDHRFEPSSLEVPTNQRVKLLVKNSDTAAEEFESDDLRIEKVIPAGREATIFIGPLKPGTYKFKGEYNPTTALGTVVVK